MTKPSEDFKTWLDSVVEDTFNFAKNPPIDWPHISWLAYLEGRDARPVVVPVLILGEYRTENYWRCSCKYMLMFPNDPSLTNYKSKYCPDCGALLDWSKANG